MLRTCIIVINVGNYPFRDFLMLGSFSLWIYDVNISLKEKKSLSQVLFTFLTEIIPVSGPV